MAAVLTLRREALLALVPGGTLARSSLPGESSPSSTGGWRGLGSQHQGLVDWAATFPPYSAVPLSKSTAISWEGCCLASSPMPTTCPSASGASHTFSILILITEMKGRALGGKGVT